MIDYTKRLNTQREDRAIADLNYSIESDRGRIINSAAFRRLQKRTQVFALELNAAVRTRLSHSLEVQQNARYIAKTIISNLKEEHQLITCKLEGLEDAFVSTVEMAALLHDIGNPPFGHFAEEAINEWFSSKGREIAYKLFDNNDKMLSLLLKDLENFDGNAQALRIVGPLQRMNLSFSQLATITKYTRPAYSKKPSKEDSHSYLMKKPGFFYSEEPLIRKVQDALNMDHNSRFVLTYIMEAADDISYLSADLEDAIDMRILTLDELKKYITQYATNYCEEHNIKENLLLQMLEKAEKSSNFFVALRVAFVNTLVAYAASIFIKHHEALFEGLFNNALLEFDKTSPEGAVIAVLQKISSKYIYANPYNGSNELQGHAIVLGLLNRYERLLALDYDDMKTILTTGKGDLIASRLYQRISKKQKEAYLKSIENADAITEWYYRCRLVIDYISGMTDDYALEEYRLVNAM